MIFRRRHDLVFAIYPQSRGFAFVLFEGWLAPVDWGVHEARGADKNTRCLARIAFIIRIAHTGRCCPAGHVGAQHPSGASNPETESAILPNLRSVAE